MAVHVAEIRTPAACSRGTKLLVLATVLLASSAAHADDWGVGFRVGG